MISSNLKKILNRVLVVHEMVVLVVVLGVRCWFIKVPIVLPGGY